MNTESPADSLKTGENNLERTLESTHAFISHGIAIENAKVVEPMPGIYVSDFWNVAPNVPQPTVVQPTNETKVFDTGAKKSSNNTDKSTPSRLEVQAMIDKSLHLFQERDLDSAVDNMLEKKIVHLFRDDKKKATEVLYNYIDKVVQNKVNEFFLSGAIDEMVSAKVHQLAESQDFIKLVASHIIASPALKVLITNTVKRHYGTAVASELTIANKIGAMPSSNGEDPTPLSLLIGESPKPLSTLKGVNNSKEKKKNATCHNLDPSTTYSDDKRGTKGGSNTDDSDKYLIDKGDRGAKGIKVLKPLNTYYTEALDFLTYRLRLQSQKYNGHISEKMDKWARRMNVQMKSACFRPSDPISVLSFLHNFKMACDSNGIHEGAAMWLFQYFIKEPAKAPLMHRVCLTDKDSQQKGKLTTYCQVVNYLLVTYATDDEIAKAEAGIMQFKKPERMSATLFSELLWEKALRCGRVYNDARLKALFIEGLHTSIRLSMRLYWAANKDATLHDLARHATSLSKFQEGLKKASSKEQPESRDRRKDVRKNTRPERR